MVVPMALAVATARTEGPSAVIVMAPRYYGQTVDEGHASVKTGRSMLPAISLRCRPQF
jgi:hypothetical protein